MSATPTPTNGANDSLTRSVDQANQSVHSVIDRATEAVHAPVNQLADGAHRLANKAGSVASQAAESIDGATAKLRAGPAEMVESCRSHVRESPLKALAIAAGLGLFAGLCLGRR